MTDRYLDDLSVGDHWTGPPIAVSEDAILRFAREYDAQPMHVDADAAAAGRFGGLIASGWHVAALTMQDFVATRPFGDVPMLGIKVDDLTWAKPVRPGDTLVISREIMAVTPSRSRPDRGTIDMLITATNQQGDTVLSFRNLIQLPRRSTEA